MADNNSKKRFTIKPFRAHQPMDRTDASSQWELLANAIDEIYARNASQLSFEELYRTAYNLVLHKHGDLLYDGVSSKITSHLLETVKSLAEYAEQQTASPTTSYLLLEQMKSVWREHQITMVMIRDILMYMDRTYVVSQRRQTVYELGLHLFRVTIWEHPSVCQRIIDLMIASIAHERAGLVSASERASSASATGGGGNDNNTTTGAAGGASGTAAASTTTTTTTTSTTTYHPDRDRVKSIIAMLLEMGRSDYSNAQGAGTNVYQQDFELVLLGTTQEFYHSESLSYISQNTASAYVAKATRRLAEEKERATALQLPQPTCQSIETILETEYIERHARTLVEMENSGFVAMMHDSHHAAAAAVAAAADGTVDGSGGAGDKLDEMRAMYDLFVRVPKCVDYLRDALAKQIKQDGTQLIQDQSKGELDASQFVRGCLTMRSKYAQVVEVAFRSDKRSFKRLRESFEDFLNQDARAASCLAVYVDELLRHGLRGLTEEQATKELEKAILIFRYLADKDVFESFYKQHLAKRLLGGKSCNDDYEKLMVSLLKAECGYQFTTKLEGMFNDMRISRETRDKYKTHYTKKQRAARGANNNKPVEIEVDVLTTGYWPTSNPPPCSQLILPPQITTAVEDFSTYYLEKHTGRKLSWQTSAGLAEIRATYASTKTAGRFRYHELCVSTYQMCILLLFNTTDQLTLGQIRSATHIPDQELRRHLISLTTPKNRLLKKGSKGRGITSDDDTFTYNGEYASKLKRVKIPLVKETSVVNNSQQAASGAGAAAAGQGTSSSSQAAAAATSGIIDGSIPITVEEDRRHLVEAAIVRIMKARKSLNHNELIAEVTRQLQARFNPTPQFIKKRIESLIEREYLERSQDEHRVYVYVA